jgi:hypothetical protein
MLRAHISLHGAEKNSDQWKEMDPISAFLQSRVLLWHRKKCPEADEDHPIPRFFCAEMIEVLYGRLPMCLKAWKMVLSRTVVVKIMDVQPSVDKSQEMPRDILI